MAVTSHKEIRTRGISKDILDLYYKDKLSIKAIAERYNMAYESVRRFLMDEKFKNYSDEGLEAISLTEDVSPFSVITNFFQGVQHAQKELAFTAIMNQKYREEIARILSEEGGITALTKGDNYAVLSQWYNNSSKLSKLIESSQKHLEGYINLFSQVLDVQREVSFVKVVTDLLRKEDPVMYARLQKALDADPETKLVLDSLANEDLIFYWDSALGKVAAIEDTKIDDN